MVLLSYILVFFYQCRLLRLFSQKVKSKRGREARLQGSERRQLAAQDLTGRGQGRRVGLRREQESVDEPGAGRRSYGQRYDADGCQQQGINGKLQTENSVFQVYLRRNGNEQNSEQQNSNDRVPKSGHVAQGLHRHERITWSLNFNLTFVTFGRKLRSAECMFSPGPPA